MKTNLQIKNADSTFYSSGCSWEHVFFPGTWIKMCTGTAFGECTVRGNGRTVVGTGTGIYGGLNP